MLSFKETFVRLIEMHEEWFWGLLIVIIGILVVMVIEVVIPHMEHAKRLDKFLHEHASSIKNRHGKKEVSIDKDGYIIRLNGNKDVPTGLKSKLFYGQGKKRVRCTTTIWGNSNFFVKQILKKYQGGIAWQPKK